MFQKGNILCHGTFKERVTAQHGWVPICPALFWLQGVAAPLRGQLGQLGRPPGACGHPEGDQGDHRQTQGRRGRCQHRWPEHCRLIIVWLFYFRERLEVRCHGAGPTVSDHLHCFHCDTFTKLPLFQRNRLTCSGNPTFESCVEVKAEQR